MVIVLQSKESPSYGRQQPPPPPPPPYQAASSLYAPQYRNSPYSPPPFESAAFTQSSPATFQSLPQHVLLQIIASIISSARTPAQHTRLLHWLAHSLRLVSRSLYIACMHHLRSAYLQVYVSCVKPPYTSDPFPMNPPEASIEDYTSLRSIQRETAVLDLFLVMKCLDDLRADSTELHLELDSFKDIFDLMQPKARTEDLVRYYGQKARLVTINPPLNQASTSLQGGLRAPIPFSLMSVTFSPRKVGLMVARRTVVEVRREPKETLESVAKRIVQELGGIVTR
ncbi:hypothetical protein FRC02_008871 [Tulasnella sp. 418]|nr:hypothetical protein FRC02_008871 [Tulasnella sp. 418]